MARVTPVEDAQSEPDGFFSTLDQSFGVTLDGTYANDDFAPGDPGYRGGGSWRAAPANAVLLAVGFMLAVAAVYAVSRF